MNTGELSNVIAKVSATLDGLSIPFHLTGGVVVSYYGEARMTVDVDVVCRLDTSAQVRELIDALQEGFIVDLQSAQSSLRDHQMFQALDNETLLKVDFHVGERIPGELERSVPIELFPGVHTMLVSAEDAILSKLIWHRSGSERSWKDAVQMMRRQRNLDLKLMEQLAERLELTESVGRLFTDAAMDD